MGNEKMKFLGAAAVGVLLAAALTASDAEAKLSGWLYGPQIVEVPASEVIGAGGTITADACGGLKRISATADRTTDTTNTFTAPSAANKGCKMLVVNVSATQTIYLDSNTLFPVTSAASLAIGPKGSVWVVSDGTTWHHSAWTEY